MGSERREREAEGVGEEAVGEGGGSQGGREGPGMAHDEDLLPARVVGPAKDLRAWREAMRRTVNGKSLLSLVSINLTLSIRESLVDSQEEG